MDPHIAPPYSTPPEAWHTNFLLKQNFSPTHPQNPPIHSHICRNSNCNLHQSPIGSHPGLISNRVWCSGNIGDSHNLSISPARGSTPRIRVETIFFSFCLFFCPSGTPGFLPLLSLPSMSCSEASCHYAFVEPRGIVCPVVIMNYPFKQCCKLRHMCYSSFSPISSHRQDESRDMQQQKIPHHDPSQCSLPSPPPPRSTRFIYPPHKKNKSS